MTEEIPKKAGPDYPDWHPADIKAALHKRGITLASLAKKYRLRSASTLSVALVRSSPTGEQRIAQALGLHPKDIWPSRYNRDGSRKPQGAHALRAH